MARRATAVSLACLLAAGPALPPQPALVAQSVCVKPKPGRRSTDDPRSPEPRSLRPNQVSDMLADLGRRLRGRTPPDIVTVPTRVHVLTDGVRRASDQAAREQIDTLNAAYSGRYGGVDTGVRFRLDEISVELNTGWFTDPVGNETAMKRALRRGGPETLNLYLAQLSDAFLGFSTYPYLYDSDPVLDGVVIDWRTLPGGSLVDYDRGFTGVHEIGHWLGLFHTFDNGCDDPGDGIADTAPEARPTEGCPTTKDTCPDAGDDPMHNFMDYADDECMREFTSGQAIRMREAWAAYRTPRSSAALRIPGGVATVSPMSAIPTHPRLPRSGGK
ncbi:zinc metalloprotease [Nonomuraea sp. NPDC005983]|uniref:zinc metalloprotease n=1 Tax=Nonomuraea sp. NPDC005983 TaxID=3155595 RepID=UPI0033BCE2AB